MARAGAAPDAGEEPPGRAAPLGDVFGEGLLVQLANPKAAVFMIAFYPQFVPADGPVFATTALLGLLQITVETVLYLALAAGVARAGAWFRVPGSGAGSRPSAAPCCWASACRRRPLSPGGPLDGR